MEMSIGTYGLRWRKRRNEKRSKLLPQPHAAGAFLLRNDDGARQLGSGPAAPERLRLRKIDRYIFSDGHLDAVRLRRGPWRGVVDERRAALVRPSGILVAARGVDRARIA